MHVYDNPVGCLTNNPQFPKQLFNLNNYADVSAAMPKNNFSDQVKMDGYSRGLGSHNLPGGMDSESRFVRVAFNKFNAPTSDSEEENVDTYFHILHSVEQQKGLDQVGPDAFEYTIYSDGINLDKGIFYYTTYTNKQINVVDMNKEDLDQEITQLVVEHNLVPVNLSMSEIASEEVMNYEAYLKSQTKEQGTSSKENKTETTKKTTAKVYNVTMVVQGTVQDVQSLVNDANKTYSMKIGSVQYSEQQEDTKQMTITFKVYMM